MVGQLISNSKDRYFQEFRDDGGDCWWCSLVIMMVSNDCQHNNYWWSSVVLTKKNVRELFSCLNSWTSPFVENDILFIVFFRRKTLINLVKIKILYHTIYIDFLDYEVFS